VRGCTCSTCSVAAIPLWQMHFTVDTCKFVMWDRTVCTLIALWMELNWNVLTVLKKMMCH